MRHPARLCIAVLALLGMLVSVAPTASAASYRTWIAQEPAAPAAGQSVAVWVDSDTAPGESAGLEYRVGGAYTKVLGSYDTSHPGANWKLLIPAQSNDQNLWMALGEVT